MMRLLALLCFLLMGADAPPLPVAKLTVEVVDRFPHDPAAFTQGLLFYGGDLYESTGQVGRSEIRRVRLRDGKVLKSTALPSNMFGEGMTRWRGDLISITWRNATGFRWDVKSLKQKQRFSYPGEGWGLTDDGTSLYMSDGTAEIRVLDPVTFAEQRRIPVTIAGRPLRQLNELEWIKGSLYANVWYTSSIVQIDPATGHVIAVINLARLTKEVGAKGDDDVLNGIAYDPARDLLLVTGKNWPTVFAVRITPALPKPAA
jgi:glutaminyl-peptide cyclotransferase